MLLAGFVVKQRLSLKRLLDSRKIDLSFPLVAADQVGRGLQGVEGHSGIALGLLDQELARLRAHCRTPWAQTSLGILERSVDDLADLI